jgi:hypothetical protein
MVYSDRLIEGSPKNSTSSIMPWGQNDQIQLCEDFVEKWTADHHRNAVVWSASVTALSGCAMMPSIICSSPGRPAASSTRSIPETRNFTRGKVERRGAQLEKSVARYLMQFDMPTCRSCRKSWRRVRLKEKLVKLESELQCF